MAGAPAQGRRSDRLRGSVLNTSSRNRAEIAPGAAAGVTEPMIEALVRAFYGRVRADEVLGPVFEAAVEDWDEHLAKLCDFWSSVLLMTGRFKGRPMAVHVRVPGISQTHFARWLGLFGETAREVWPPDAAALVIEKAEMIGRSLQLGIAVSRGELPTPRGA